MSRVDLQTPSRSSRKGLFSHSSKDSFPLREWTSPFVGQKNEGRKTPSGGYDRFIPNRKAMDFAVCQMLLAKENSGAVNSPKNEEYKRKLAENFMKTTDENSRILSFKNKPPPPPEGFENSRRSLFSQTLAATSPRKSKKMFRHIPQAPERTLDAPDLLDDYYLNLLDWSSNNVVAVALGRVVYLWNASTSSIEELMHVEDEGPITSISWAPDGYHIAVGLNNADVQLWDTRRLRQVRSLKGHSARVGSLAWNEAILSTGSRDNVIFNHDVRIREHITSRLLGHEQEVCGLRWAPSGRQLASGGNDNLLHIWDSAGSSTQGITPYLHRLDEHQGAVKALAWCPFQANLLASGGGTADRCIKFWNTHTGACVNSIDTESQVCALQWSRHERELLSSHGFSQNQLCLWKYPSMVKMAELTGHSSRVLHLAQSPDGYTVASAAGDETLRFWQVFGAPEAQGRRQAKKVSGNGDGGVPALHHIR